jgi:hypothetical protein
VKNVESVRVHRPSRGRGMLREERKLVGRENVGRVEDVKSVRIHSFLRSHLVRVKNSGLPLWSLLASFASLRVHTSLARVHLVVRVHRHHPLVCNFLISAVHGARRTAPHILERRVVLLCLVEVRVGVVNV